jgi:hypothetical protein
MVSLLSKLFHKLSRDDEHYYMDEDEYNKEVYNEEEEDLYSDSVDPSEQEPRFHDNMTEPVSESDEEEEEYEIVEREILPAKIICPDCGGITLEGLDFCDKCGGELQ